MRANAVFPMSIGLSLLFMPSLLRGQSLLRAWDGEAAGDNFGTVVVVEDVDGDGFDELAAGALAHDGVTGPDSGRVYVYSGRDGHLVFTSDGSGAPVYFGFSIAPCGDTNRDGFNDILVGAPVELISGVYGGAAYVLGGPDGRILQKQAGEGTFDYFGWALTGLGDVDGDGSPDFAAGAPNHTEGSYSTDFWEGAVYVYSGRTGASLRELSGQQNYNFFGGALLSGMTHPVEHQGPRGHLGAGRHWRSAGVHLPDLIIGAYGFDGGSSHDNWDRGRIYFSDVHADKAARKITGRRHGDAIGALLASVGDLDDDGFTDVLSNVGTSGAVVYSGRDGSELQSFSGIVVDSLDGGEDVDGDGWADFLFGDVEDVVGDARDGPGKVLVYSGRTSQLLARLHGENVRDYFGLYAVFVPDITGDGRAEILVGARLHDGVGVDSGKAYLFAGDDLFLEADPGVAKGGQTVSLITRGAAPAVAALLMLTEINGSSTSLPVTAGTTDATGAWTVAGKVPNGFAGTTLALTSFSFGDDGSLEQSPPAAVLIQ